MIHSPLPASAGRCYLVHDFLSADECLELIALSEGRGYAEASTDYPPSYRNNHRHVIDSNILAARLGERMERYAPASIDIDGQPWCYAGVNERLRFCRYGAGQRFNLHQDGVHHRGTACRSQLTVLIYLSYGAAFEGGDTVFHAAGPSAGEAHELGRVRPRAGSLLLFDHAIWHAGEEVTAGTKHVLRSDVLYQAAAPDALDADPGLHQGYVWSLADLGEGWMASGGRDASIRVHHAGQVVRQLRGHDLSVLGLAPLSGQRLASVSRDRTLRIWDWTTGSCTSTLRAHESAVLDVIALTDGRLATGGADGLVKLWEQDGRAAGTLGGHTGWVWQLADLGGGRIASASEDGSVRIWDTATMRCGALLAGEQPLRTLLAIDGALWTGDIGGRMQCWVPHGGGWTRSVSWRAHDAAIRRLRDVGPGMVASCGEDCALRVWRLADGTRVFEARHDNFVTDARRQDDTLVSSSYDGRILRHPWPAPAL